MRLLSSADFIQNYFFKKNFMSLFRVSISLDLDQGRRFVLTWVQTVCKGYQETKKSPLTREGLRILFCLI